jgi:peptide deformylase
MSDAAPATTEELRDEALFEGDPDEAPEGLDQAQLERRSEALAQVRRFGDPALRSRATPVTQFDGVLHEEVERMVSIMRDALGVGLAATQLGILHRVLVFQAGRDAQPTALVNPEIEWSSEQLATAEEGCLSLPGVVVDVERSLYVRARGQDQQGEPITVEASGLEARVIQHEIDHLDGVLILDRTDRESKREALRALREGPAAEDGQRPEPAAAEG